MRTANLNFTNSFINTTQNLQQQQYKLQGQASSGLTVTLPEDNPGVMAEVLNQQTSSAQNSQYQANITQLQSGASTAATAMNTLQSLISQANEIATTASSGTTSSTQMTAYATQVQSLLQEAVSLGNTKNSDGNYIFGGTDSGSPPFSATTDASGNITGVTYNGNTSTAESSISSNMTVTASVPGANTSGSGATGLFTDSRTGADLFSHLISLGNDLSSGNTSAISTTDAPALAKDETNIVNQISANGVMQSALTAAGNMATSQSTNITTQISGETNADLAQTLTQLDQTQTAYQAALESGTMVMQVSLLNFLG
jgi:flagellar hook-associated protein 3 FlgL